MNKRQCPICGTENNSSRLHILICNYCGFKGYRFRFPVIEQQAYYEEILDNEANLLEKLRGKNKHNTIIQDNDQKKMEEWRKKEDHNERQHQNNANNTLPPNNHHHANTNKPKNQPTKNRNKKRQRNKKPTTRIPKLSRKTKHKRTKLQK